MQVEVIKKNLWHYIETPEGAYPIPELPAYRPKKGDSVFVWKDGKPVQMRPATGVVTPTMMVPEEYFVKAIENEDITFENFGDKIEGVFNEGNKDLDEQIEEAIRQIAEAADKAKVIESPTHENKVRVIQYIRLDTRVLPRDKPKGWLFEKICGLVAEAI